MRSVLDHFWKFAHDFSRFCPFYAGSGSRLTAARLAPFSQKAGPRGVELLLAIQAFFAHEWTPSKVVNVDLVPSRSTERVELLTRTRVTRSLST
jgi:hypothetical protein